MLRYIGKRLLMMIPVIIGISLLIYLVMGLTPGDPARQYLGPLATEDELNAYREEMGLNEPILVQYLKYMAGAVQGDFGVSLSTKGQVWDEIKDRIPTTVALAFSALLVMLIGALPAGIISAVKQYSALDYSVTVLALIMTSIPGFWAGMMLMLLFSLKLGWLPSVGVGTWQHFVLPAITAAITMLASLLRMTRSNMLEVIRADYITTARAKGLPERVVIFRHALRNALLPVLTIIGINFGLLLGGAMATETVFAMPGIGTLLIAAVRAKDYPLAVTIIILTAIVISLMNLLVDILYAFVDPRIKSQYVGKARRKRAPKVQPEGVPS